MRLNLWGHEARARSCISTRVQLSKPFAAAFRSSRVVPSSWWNSSYGYRGRDCRSNLYLLPTGETVYFIASVVVLFNVDEQLQRHYTGHTDDIKW